MLAHEIRQKYLDFFKSKGHVQLQSAPLVPIDILGVEDKTTLFTTAGMQQFMPYFLGTATAEHSRVSTVQKCLRTNDIDSVGDFSHCTFFEMLGNFSFGDYFKAEVIPWTWEFLIQWVGIDPDRICVTVYKDDDEAFRIWNEVIGLPKDRIHRQGEDKNYWPANVISEGPNQPCGPCSEIFYRTAPLEEMCSDPNLTQAQRYTIDDDAGRYVEIWNNVFTQFDRSEGPDGKPILTPLPKKNNDTGAGLDRIAYVSQGKTSVFETDLFLPTLEHIEKLSGLTYESSSSPRDFAFRVVAEHTRSTVFCIADGILPSNEGRGYVLRYIMRRAIRYGKMALGFDQPFLHQIAPKIIEQMGDFYPELEERRELILRNIHEEEERFHRTLDNGSTRLDEMLARPEIEESKLLSGADVFMLYDTFGFPVKLTQEIAGEKGIQIDLDGFQAAMETQRKQSRATSNIQEGLFLGDATQLNELDSKNLAKNKFIGYKDTYAETRLLAIINKVVKRINIARAGEEVIIVLDETPFYAESGGQVGDKGWITGAAGDVTCAIKMEVLDTQKNALGVYLHTVKILEGEVHDDSRVTAQIDIAHRDSIRRNHTATHLLQAALRTVLGSHVHQKGSKVAPDRLRFDFTHFQPLTPDEIHRIEEIVNTEILRDISVQTHEDLPIAEAKARGAMALFGEKYGEFVRLVEIASFSQELCGGTHVKRTSQIGLFKIVSENGVSSGVRRIEAVTGKGTLSFFNQREEMIAAAGNLLKSNPSNLSSAIEKLIAQKQELEHQIRQWKASGGSGQASDFTPQMVEGVAVVTQQLDGADAETIANIADMAAKRLQSVVVLLASVTDGKVAFAVKVTPDLVAKGLHAGNLVREVAKIAGGGGGGRADFAQAGGRDPGKIEEAINAVPALVTAQVRGAGS